jgi:hypothetical protein
MVDTSLHSETLSWLLDSYSLLFLLNLLCLKEKQHSLVCADWDQYKADIIIISLNGDVNGVNKIRNPKKDRQHNGQM